jgi:hypothetical protein
MQTESDTYDLALLEAGQASQNQGRALELSSRNSIDPSVCIATSGEAPKSSSGWEECLDKESNIKVFEYSSNSGLSQGREAKPDDFKAELSDSGSIRLFLMEGLSNEVISNFGRYLNVDKEFFHHHYLDCLSHDRRRSTPDGRFFAKWSRRVLQECTQGFIRAKISSGQPYDLDIYIDPHHIGIDHDRYHKFPNIHRQYDLLDAHFDSIQNPLLDSETPLKYAAKECISFYYKPATSGYIGNIRLVSRNFENRVSGC